MGNWADGTSSSRQAATVEPGGALSVTTLTTGTSGITLASNTHYRDLVVDATALTTSTLFTGTSVSNVVVDNVRITGLDTTQQAFQFTGCTNVAVRNCYIAAGGKGITFDACDYVVAEGNTIRLSADVTSGFVGHGILYYANAAPHAYCRISDNTITGVIDYNHGIYCWGSNAATLAGPVYASDIVIADNVIDGAEGGIWFSKCQRVSVTGNVVRTCDDVGIDFEGCLDCVASGNVVSNVRAGALSALYNSKRILFTGNVVSNDTHTTLLGGAGHLAESSWICAYIRDTCEDISFVGNEFVSTVTGSKMGEVNIWKNAETAGPTRISFRGNRFRNGCIFGLSQISQIVVEDNDFYHSFQVAASVIEIDQSPGVEIRDNRLSAASDSTANTRGTSPIQVYQGSASSTLRTTDVVIEGNHIANYPSVGIEVDTYNGTDYTATFIVRNNDVGFVFSRTSKAATFLITGNVLPTAPQTSSTSSTW